MWNYSEKMMDHFKNPRNLGDLPDANAVGMVGNITCGDALKIFLKIDEATSRILDVTFKTYGCGSAIASSSALTEMVKGRTLDEALKITNQEIADYLGGLPEEKMHCSVMGREALEDAIRKFRGVPTHQEVEEAGEIVCRCFHVSRAKIERVVREEKLRTVDEVTHFTKAGGACGACKEEIARIIEGARGKGAADAPPVTPFAKMTMVQKIHLLEAKINGVVRPGLQNHGGDLEFVGISGDTVEVKLRGACSACASSKVTLHNFVQAKLRELIDPAIVVREVAP